MEFSNCAQAFLIWYSYGTFGDVPRETDIVEMGSEVLSLLRDAVPWDAKQFGHRENIGEVVREDVRQGLSGDGWLAEEDKVVDPFDDWVDAVVSEYPYARICDHALNTTCCCQSFNGDMLDIYVAAPQNCKVSLVIRDYGRVSVHLCYV